MNVKLVREPITIPNDAELNRELRELYHEASKRTGYGFSPDLPDHKLMETLQKLNIQPLKFVDEYKEEMTKVPYWQTEEFGKSLGKTASVIGKVSFVTSVVTAFANGTEVLPHAGWRPAVLFALAIVCLGTWIKSETWKYVRREWRLTGLEYYHGAVPPFAMQMVVAISRVLPEASFGVDYLEQTTKRREPVVYPDPILHVRLGTEKFYFAAWDEPKLTAKNLVA